MANRSRTTLVSKILGGKGPIRPRSLALLLMVTGAFGFAISLVALNQQTLCLFASTVVVFFGLLIILLSKKYSGNLSNEDEDLLDGELHSQFLRRPGMRNLWQERSSPTQAPAPDVWSSKPATGDRKDQPQPQSHVSSTLVNSGSKSTLNERSAAIFARQGAKVFIDKQREGRAILTVDSASGKRYIIMIDDGNEVIDVSDLRALNSLMTNEGAEGALFISSASFSSQAQAWAQKKLIQLYEAYQVDSIRIE
jgi:hypothetical protein